jgi:hypothetical protein
VHGGTLLLLSAACAADPLVEINRQVFAEEERLAAQPVPYPNADTAPDGLFRPTGVFAGRDAVAWVYSRTQTRQIGLELQGDTWTRRRERRGPRKTIECSTTTRNDLCLGLAHPGGLTALPGAGFASGLEPRGYYSGFATGDQALIVVDSLRHELLTLAGDGRVVSRQPLLAGSYDAVPLGDGRFVVAAWAAPHLYLFAPGRDHAHRPLLTDVPVRDFVVDRARRIVWTIGPAAQRPRREQGYLEGLHTMVYGFRLAELDAGKSAPAFALDFRAHRLVDGTSLALWGEQLVAVATGSDRLWIIHPESGREVVLATGVTPQRPAVIGDDLLVPTMLDDGVTVVRRRGEGYRIKHLHLGGAAPAIDSPARLGELLFYKKILWADRVENDFTCNSCHWDTTTDHRLQPGSRESRWEITRPLQGAGMVAPMFTPMQSKSLTEAIDGFVRSLDHRYWNAPDDDLFTKDIHWTSSEGRRSLSPLEARRALLTFIMKTPPERGPLRLADGTFSGQARTGFDLFVRDCLRCHEATANMRSRQRIAPAQLLAHLETRAVSFGAPLYSRSGIEPYYTRHGNRISPLIALWRGGPYFSNGSAPTLWDVIASTNPKADEVHAPKHREARSYSPAEAEALVTFLLSL